MFNLKKVWVATLVSGAMALSSFAQANITVFAAASMTNALEQAKSEYLKTHPKAEIDLSFASSSVLARQINQGAPANIFVSANQKWMDYLAEKGNIEADSRRDLASNALVMIAPESSKVSNVNLAQNQWIQDLGNSYLAVGNPDHVPAGKYAKAALQHFNQWPEVENKLARANNVRAALALVEQGESPLGIVYATDANMSKKVKIVATYPADSHPKILYPAALVKGQDTQESREFLNYLSSKSGQAILAQYGFVTAN